MVHGVTYSGAISRSVWHGVRNFHRSSWSGYDLYERVHQDRKEVDERTRGVVKVAPHKFYNMADQLSATAAIGYGAKVSLLGEVDLIVSIIAGVLVAISAGLSIYLNLKRHKQEQQDDQS
jgi:hypothetical protein